jgi:hypothetical protein
MYTTLESTIALPDRPPVRKDLFFIGILDLGDLARLVKDTNNVENLVD